MRMSREVPGAWRRRGARAGAGDSKVEMINAEAGTAAVVRPVVPVS
jgi:hypothetical protein